MFALLGSKALVSCNGELIDRENTNVVHEELFSKDGESVDYSYATQEANNSMVSFVNGLREYYTPGMTFEQFKLTLDSEKGLSNITKEGNDLLFAAYGYLKNNTSTKNIKGKEMMMAMKAMIQHNIDKGINTSDNFDFATSERWLFGLSENYAFGNEISRGGCRWYQLGCHISGLWQWLTSPSTGGGGGTNASTLISIISIIISIIKL